MLRLEYLPQKKSLVFDASADGINLLRDLTYTQALNT